MADKILPVTKHDLPGMNHEANAVIQSGVLRVTCMGCGERFSKQLSANEETNVVAMYENGGFHPAGHVQDVFPNWSVADRELFLMSHLCPKCWNELMSSGEAGEE